MRSLRWSTSDAVFVTEIDDEHKEIFEALSAVQRALVGHSSLVEIGGLTKRLAECISEHFAHEERLMRAARYDSIRWHKEKHHGALRRVRQFAERIQEGDASGASELIEYLTAWLHEHSRLADRMMGSFLRNHRRGLCKVTFRAGTKPIDACAWVDANGDILRP